MGHGRDAGKILFGILWPVPAAQGSHHANDFAPKLQAAVYQGVVEKLADKGIRSNEDVSARTERPTGEPSPLDKKFPQATTFLAVKGRKSRQGRSRVAVERWRNPPNSAFPIGTFF
jgi:hypothetical protein